MKAARLAKPNGSFATIILGFLLRLIIVAHVPALNKAISLFVVKPFILRASKVTT